MEFSRQDARFEAKPLDLSEYSAADMMADLGIHRRVTLPLQGRALVITPPPPDIHKRGPMLALMVERDAPVVSAWNSLYDPELAESRHDGLGAGQMHRTGANFNPDQVRQRSPPRLRRTRSAEGHEANFELGRRPSKPLQPRKLSESLQTVRRVSERRRDRSPDERDSDGDIMAELRAESKIRMSKYRATRTPGKTVVRHVSGNTPVSSRSLGKRAVSLLPHTSSRTVPPNPLTSQWGVGIKLATAKAGYDYALDLDSKKINKASADSVTPQARVLNKINKVISQSMIVPPRVPVRPVSTVTPTSANLPSRPNFTKAPPVASPLPSVTAALTRSRSTSLSVSTQLPLTETGGWAGDKPFSAEVEQKLADVTNCANNTSEAADDDIALAKPAENSELNRLDPDKPSDPSPTDEVLSHALQQKEPLEQIPEADNTEDTDANSEFDVPPTRNNSIADSSKPIQRKGSSHHLGEDMDHMDELLMDLQAIGEAVKELKTKYLECDSFEATLTTRLRELRSLKKDVLHEIKVDEDLLLGLRREITILRAKRVATAEKLRAVEDEKEVPRISEEEEKEQAESTMEAELETMISEHEALMNEHEIEEDQDVSMVDVQDEEYVDEEPVEETPVEEVPVEEVPIEQGPIEQGPIEQELIEELAEEELAEEELAEEKSAKKQSVEEEPIGEKKPAEKELIEEKPTEKGPAGEEPVEEEPLEEKPAEKESIEKKELAEENPATENEHAKKEKTDEPRIENEQVLEKIETFQNVCTSSDNSRKDAVEKEKACLQTVLITAELLKKEKRENNHLATELLKQEQKDHRLQNKIEKVEATLTLHRENSRQKLSEAECVGAILEKRTTKEVEDKQYDKQTEKERLENSRIEKIHLEEQRLERERHENARIEANRLKMEQERERAESLRLEEQLVSEHMEKVRIQEELFKSERSEHARAQEERLRVEREENSRLGAEKLAKEIELALFNERLDDEHESLEKKLKNLEKRTTRNKRSKGEHPAAKPTRLQFEERKPWTPTPEPITRPVSPALSTTSIATKPTFPYNLELDLRPMYGPHPLRVQIEQFGRPQETILKRCDEILSLAEYSKLMAIPEFQKFLVDCDERHSRRMAKAYGNPRRS